MTARVRVVRRWACEVYDVAIFVVSGPLDGLNPWLARTFGEDYTSDHEGRPLARTMWLEHERGCALVLWFPPSVRPETPKWAAIIAHEAVHGACYIFRSRGVELAEPAEEALTYYVGYLVRAMTEGLLRRKR